MARTLLPNGHLFTYEFNELRAKKGQEDFVKLGMADNITQTHRDVLANGFLLDDKVTPESIDAVFLDLPSPEQAVKHAYQVLKTKGRLCNFSPCIEQVQKASQEMATLGFYDIRTFECLCREAKTETFSYSTIHHDGSAPKEQHVGTRNKNQKKFK